MPTHKISDRLKTIVDALPLKEGMRVLEIGCGPGVAAREIIHRFSRVYVLAIDRSARAIQQALQGSVQEMETGRLKFRQAAAENFYLLQDEAPFDLVFAIRVGVFDGRYPRLEQQSLKHVKAALKRNGRFFIDETGSSVEEIGLDQVSFFV